MQVVEILCFIMCEIYGFIMNERELDDDPSFYQLKNELSFYFERKCFFYWSSFWFSFLNFYFSSNFFICFSFNYWSYLAFCSSCFCKLIFYSNYFSFYFCSFYCFMNLCIRGFGLGLSDFLLLMSGYQLNYSAFDYFDVQSI